MGTHSGDHRSPEPHRSGLLRSRASPMAESVGSPETQGAPGSSRLAPGACSWRLWWPLSAALNPGHGHGTQQ